LYSKKGSLKVTLIIKKITHKKTYIIFIYFLFNDGVETVEEYPSTPKTNS